MRSVAAWAEAESQCPSRIKIFFIDDFVTNPAVAVAGLAKFVGVSEFSPATENAVNEFTRIASTSPMRPPSGQLARDMLRLDTIEELTQEFESLIINAPEDLRNSWAVQLSRWLSSRNPRLVAWASSAGGHEPWNPARWWALHSARVCRPCIFYPRGKCSEDDCRFCHGPGHAKPKRPSHGRRKQRNAYDRTPSPDITSHRNSTYPAISLG